MPVPVRYPSGVATSPIKFLYGDYPAPTPPRVAQYFNDFFTYAAGDWTVTATTGTTALTSGAGGKIIQTTAATTDNIQANQLATTSYLFAAGQKCWFNINFALSDVDSLFLAGLANSFATLAPTSGVYFSKAKASATLNLILNKASATTTIAVGTVAAATAYSVGFYWDGGTLYVYSSIGLPANNAFGQPYYPGGVVVAAAGPDSANAITNLPTAALTMGFGLGASADVAETCTVDYVLATQEVVARF